MEITFLGTSGCIPTKERGLPAIHLDYLGEHLLFDCGEGTQRQMRISGINFMHLDNIFLTHLHADHFMGLGGMLQSMDFLERIKPITIHGPEGTKKLVDTLVNLGHFTLDHLTVNANEVEPNQIAFRGKRYSVKTFKTIHTKNSLGYIFCEDSHRKFQRETALKLGVPEGRKFHQLSQGETVEANGKQITPDQVLGPEIPGRKIVITGDTRPTQNTIEAAQNADLLIHEAMFSQLDENATKDAAHTTTTQAAEIAKKANVKQLILTHISQRYQDPQTLQHEAQTTFKNTIIAADHQKIKIPKHW